MDFLLKLQKAKELIEKYAGQAADGLEYGADVLHNIEEAMRDAAAFLKQPVLMGATGEPQGDLIAELEACRCEVPTPPVGGPAAVGANPAWLLLLVELAPVLNKAIDLIIERIRDRRAEG